MNAPAKIVTHCEFPPIPVRDHDWCAWYEGLGPECACGWGETEAAAIADLRDNYDAPVNISATEVTPMTITDTILLDTVAARKAELLGDVDEDHADAETQGRLAHLSDQPITSNPYADDGVPGWAQPLRAQEWRSGWLSEQAYQHGNKGQK